MKKIYLLLAIATTIPITALASKPLQMKSPNGHITAEIGSDGKSITLNHTDGSTVQKAIEITSLGLGIDNTDNSSWKYTGCSKPKTIKDDYTIVGHKKARFTNKANEYALCYTDDKQRDITVALRLYNDGAALQYTVTGLENAAVTDDYTTYRIAEGTTRWIQKYNDVYEDFFPCMTTGRDNKNKASEWGYPTLVKSADDVYTLISEAGIGAEHSASYLSNVKNRNDYKVTLAANDLRYNGTYTSPWRVAIIGSLGELIESTLITDVSPATEYEDISWIHPGSVSWVYWAYNHGSNDYQIVKKYIDMASELSLPYVLIDAEWDEMGNGGNIDDALAYAKQKGVKVMIWYNSSTAWVNNGAPGPFYRLNKPEDREKEYAWLEANGVAGVKIDFFTGDTQPTMAYCIDLLKDAAKHHLMVNFHGATIPRGWQRTYPNLMSVEAVYGAEWYNNLPVLTEKAAAHNATLPFTRNIIGPMDYTPCTFSDSQHQHITTNAHELALPVLFESALLHWADKPESYLPQPQPVRHFISTLPTVWDETRLISGYPGDHVVMARRSGKTWWIAGINGTDEEKTISLDLKPLKLKGKETCCLYEDTDEGGNTWKITNPRGLNIKEITLKPRGGFVAVVNK